MPKPHPTVNRVVLILETVAAEPNGLTLSALARHIDVPKSTVHTLVNGLLSTSFLEEQTGLLSLGPAVEQLASSRGGHQQLRRLAHEELLTLSANTDETAHMSIRAGDSVIIIDQVESTQPIRYTVALRAPRPLLTTSTGKLFLAELGPAELETVLADLGQTKSPAGAVIREQRNDIRSRGVAYNLEESVSGVCTVGAAVRGASGSLVGGLVVAGPADRVRPKLDKIEPMLRQAAQRLSDRLR
ncbi:MULTISPECIES: IclR family transcriptional regulator [unclassified Rhodococcus (in: high G+C Gram-positive bacteria)]|uniref:IclR family transcriptional regulator n=1 Tax=unclassified Rhodococcus (in: high G+C Gram-positive bacteria) TaxID=192944 RepID=UPI0015E87912|nr:MULTISPECIES: IclR family transcriptional regulator [unclassified Rhodococcus (in: high G+C Gram-positive bacteria)]